MDQDGQSSTSAASPSPPTAYLTLERTRSMEVSNHEQGQKDEEQMDSLAQRFAETKMLVPNQVRFGKKASKK